MLYDDIQKLEKTWPDFNKESFTSEDILALAERIGIITITDKTIPFASAFYFENKHFILYNPHQSETNLVMALGHELGHFGLGHVEMDDTFLYTSPFTASGIEKDAGIIGFLFWLPTSVLVRKERKGRLDIEELYNDLRWSSDLSDNDLIKFCHSRLRIYKSFNRVTRSIRNE